MEREKFSIEDIERIGDLRIEGIIRLVIDRNKDVVKLIYDNSEKENLKENFKSAIFSNLKFKIIEALAEEMGIDSPSSLGVRNGVIEKYPEDKLQELTDKVAEEEFKKWTYRNYETPN